ncbi:YjgF/Yer057c/UK114 family protein [Pandoravirus salinus]|uniref:YjgF/Yer057c/UK114 family protein n=1 Tax=Pandoravirus salinus TaxID=1349410 RepID=S4W0G3_9VIRU|nr:YjgF/Yer057c/UK114 family protein [Pandoravirus salinus]AGO83565.1 YjgF/Yer057c/UK114 family protein [Pandoravirus salinus]
MEEGKRQTRECERHPNRSRIIKQRQAPSADLTAESVPKHCRLRDRQRNAKVKKNNNNNNKKDNDNINRNRGDDGTPCADDTSADRQCRVPPAPRFARHDTATYGFAQTVRHDDIVWVSGTVANDERGRLVEGDIRAQTRQVFDNLDASLRNAGCRGLEDIVQLDAAIVDAPRNAPGFVSVRSKRMPAGTYTSMATGVAALLVPGALVEMRCVAVASRK